MKKARPMQFEADLTGAPKIGPDGLMTLYVQVQYLPEKGNLEEFLASMSNQNQSGAQSLDAQGYREAAAMNQPPSGPKLSYHVLTDLDIATARPGTYLMVVADGLGNIAPYIPTPVGEALIRSYNHASNGQETPQLLLELAGAIGTHAKMLGESIWTTALAEIEGVVSGSLRERIGAFLTDRGYSIVGSRGDLQTEDTQNNRVYMRMVRLS